MSTETMNTSQPGENQRPRRPYTKPEMIDYGTTGDLTQSGYSTGTEDGTYTSA